MTPDPNWSCGSAGWGCALCCCSGAAVNMHCKSLQINLCTNHREPRNKVWHCRMRRLRQRGQRQLPATELSQMPAMRARRARQRPSRVLPRRSGASWPAAALRGLRGSGELTAHRGRTLLCDCRHHLCLGTRRMLCGGALLSKLPGPAGLSQMTCGACVSQVCLLRACYLICTF